MLTIGRKSLLWMIVSVVLTAAACGESPAPASPALRLVERGLRREFNTRYIAVSEPSADSLLVKAGAGRLVRGARGAFRVPGEHEVSALFTSADSLPTPAILGAALAPGALGESVR